MRTKGAWRLWKALPKAVPYLRPYRKLYIISIVLTLAIAGLALAEPWPLAVMVDSVLGKHSPPGFLQDIFGSDPDRYKLLIVVVAAGFTQTILSHSLGVLNDYFGAKLEQNMILDLRAQLFEHCQRLSLTFHDATRAGGLMYVINLQASALGAIVMAFPPILQGLLTLVGMLCIALLIDWQVALISLAIVPFIYYSLGLYGTRIVPRLRRVRRLEMESLSIVHEAMAMLRVMVTFGREPYEYRRFRKQGQTTVDQRVKLTVRQTLFRLGVSAATAAGTALVLGFGAWHVLQGKITIGELLVLIAYIAAAYQPLESISTTIGSLNDQLVMFNASLRLLDVAPEVKEDPDPVELGRAKGQITYEHVHFAYKRRVDTLKDISLEASPGERIAVVGPTGAGKTTLISLLIRFYEVNSGRILIDGIDIRRLSLRSLRNQIAVVLQEPLLFSGTIIDNIRYGRLRATMAEMVEAAKAANAHDFISALPDGYSTKLGERGARLSVGERQRICIARAFVRDAPILILDEPTSSIDSRTENVILDALDDLTVGRTSFVIAHRLSTIRDADRILVLNEGELVEQGPHDELLARGGLYAQLYEAQNQQRGGRSGDTEQDQARPSLAPVPANHDGANQDVQSAKKTAASDRR